MTVSEILEERIRLADAPHGLATALSLAAHAALRRLPRPHLAAAEADDPAPPLPPGPGRLARRPRAGLAAPAAARPRPRPPRRPVIEKVREESPRRLEGGAPAARQGEEAEGREARSGAPGGRAVAAGRRRRLGRRAPLRGRRAGGRRDPGADELRRVRLRLRRRLPVRLLRRAAPVPHRRELAQARRPGRHGLRRHLPDPALGAGHRREGRDPVGPRLLRPRRHPLRLRRQPAPAAPAGVPRGGARRPPPLPVKHRRRSAMRLASFAPEPRARSPPLAAARRAAARRRPVAPPAQPTRHLPRPRPRKGGRADRARRPAATAPASGRRPAGARRPVPRGAHRRPRRLPLVRPRRPAAPPEGASGRRARARRATPGSPPGAQYLLDTQIQSEGTNVVVSAQLFDLRTLRPILGKKYSGRGRRDPEGRPTLANDVVRQFTGQARAVPHADRLRLRPRRRRASRSSTSMDFDGENQRRLTFHSSLSLAPDWSYDGEQDRLPVVRQGPARPLLVPRSAPGHDNRIPLTTELNSSPVLLAGREDDRLLRQRQGEPRDLRRRARRLEPAPPDELHRHRLDPALRRRTAGRSPSPRTGRAPRRST